MTQKQLLTNLADKTKKQQDDAKIFIETGINTQYWIGIMEQAGLTLKMLKDNGIYPSN